MDPPVDTWVSRAQDGDRESMERLLEHFQDRVFRRALYRIGDRDEAAEVAQDVFVLCFRKIGQFRGEASFWSWLARIVDNQVKNRWDWLRRRGKGRTFSMHDMLRGELGEEDAAWDPPDEAPDPRRQAEGREAIEALEGSMSVLSEDHREILLLRFAEDLAYEEIAAQLEISIGTVKSRINRARGELRKLMGDHLES